MKSSRLSRSERVALLFTLEVVKARSAPDDVALQRRSARRVDQVAVSEFMRKWRVPKALDGDFESWRRKIDARAARNLRAGEIEEG